MKLGATFHEHPRVVARTGAACHTSSICPWIVAQSREVSSDEQFGSRADWVLWLVEGARPAFKRLPQTRPVNSQDLGVRLKLLDQTLSSQAKGAKSHS